MIGFVAAFRAEVRDVLVEISGERGERIEEAVFHRGYLGPAHFPAVLAIAGMGPVRARASAATLVERYRASLLIALGTCGGLSSALPSGTLIIPSAVRSVTSGACAGPVTPDARLQEKLMQAAASASARPVTGLLLSTERVVRTAQEKRGLADRFGGVAVDMESGAVAAVAGEAGIPFAAVRVVLDTAEEDAVVDYEELLQGRSVPTAAGAVAYLFRHPGHVCALLGDARRCRNASRKLRRCFRALRLTIIEPP